MVKAPSKDKHKPAGATRVYAPAEFEADTNEARPIALLAERRRQFLSGLKACQTNASSLADK